ncbi:hypothetical protein Vafri_463, partial [Volvox africanus]
MESDYYAKLISLHAPASKSVDLLRLLHAVDCFPRGGLYTGYYAIIAATRYERFWVEIMKQKLSVTAPPLDIAFAWFVHRQDPTAYQSAMSCKGVTEVHPLSSKAFAFGPRPSDRKTWKRVAAEHPAWPPPAPGSVHSQTSGATAFTSVTFANQLAASLGRFSQMLKSWLRPHFLDLTFLTQARDRYIRFLQLYRDHLDQRTLVPTADIALIWHTHLGLSEEYKELCTKMYGKALRPDYLHITDPDDLTTAYGETARLYQEKYGQPYDSPDTAWLADTVLYPLVSAANPVAYSLGVFDDNPERERQQTAISLACRGAGIPEPPPGVSTPRSGAHALYLTWLAAHRASESYDDLTCNRCCFTSSASVHKKTIRDVTSALVSIAYFLELPDIDTHPYLRAIVLRAGKWKPSSALEAVKPAVSVTVPFSPSDAANYLSGRPSQLLKGLTPLLAAAMQPPPPPPPAALHQQSSGPSAKNASTVAPPLDTWDSPLWCILVSGNMQVTAQDCCTSAWRLSTHRGVGLMQHAYQVRKHKHHGCYVYGPCDYYTVTTLYLADMVYMDATYYGSNWDTGGGGGCDGG